MLDIPDDVEEYTSHESSAVTNRSYSNGKITPVSTEEQDGEKLSAAALEAAASAKADKHFNLFKEATLANSSQVGY